MTVIAFEIWRYFPFAFLFLTARLVSLPGDIEEAAIVDGATPWQNFRFVVFPQLLPVIALLSVLRLIMTFNKFDDVFLLTGGGAGTEVAAVRVYDTLWAVSTSAARLPMRSSSRQSWASPCSSTSNSSRTGDGVDNESHHRSETLFGVLRWVVIVVLVLATVFPVLLHGRIELRSDRAASAAPGPALGPAAGHHVQHIYRTC